MKKLLAILLTLILTFSCFSILSVGTVSAETQKVGQVILESDFDNSDGTNWLSTNQNVTYGDDNGDGVNDYASVKVSTKSGAGLVSSPFNLIPGNEYELTYYIRVPEGSESFKLGDGTFYAPATIFYQPTVNDAGTKVSDTPVVTTEEASNNYYAYSYTNKDDATKSWARRKGFASTWTIDGYAAKNKTAFSNFDYRDYDSVLSATNENLNAAFANWTKVTVNFTAMAAVEGETSQVTALGFTFDIFKNTKNYVFDLKDVKLVCTDNCLTEKTILTSDFEKDITNTSWYVSGKVESKTEEAGDFARLTVADSKAAYVRSKSFELTPEQKYTLTYYMRIPEGSADYSTSWTQPFSPECLIYQTNGVSAGQAVKDNLADANLYSNKDKSRRVNMSFYWNIEGYNTHTRTGYSDTGYHKASALYGCVGGSNVSLNNAFKDWKKVTLEFTAEAETEGSTEASVVVLQFRVQQAANDLMYDIKDVTLTETAAIEEEEPEEIVIPELPDYPALPDVETPTGNTYTTTVTGENCNAFVSEETAIEGSKVIVSAVPYAGYKFAGWYENDVLVSPEKQFIFTINENRTLVAKSVAVTEENTEIAIYPDVSYDGMVDLTDITNIAKNLAGWDVENLNTSRIDVNGDGEVNLKDLVLSAQYVAGWDVENKLASKDAYLLPEEDLDAEGLSDTVRAGESEYFNKSTIINEGNRALFVNLFEKASRGEAITVVSIGGSVTQGVRDAEGNDRSFGKLVSEWIAEKFGVEVTNINAGIGSTGSLYGIHRLESDVLSHNPDLVILEYSVNDISSKQGKFPYLETYEAIIRRVLEKDIALLTAVFGGSGTTFYKDYLSLHIHSALHYDLPVIDYYSALFRYLENGVISWYNESDKDAGITKDNLHPNTTGHVMIASAMCYYLDDVYNKYQAGEVYETAIDIPKETLFKNADVYETATFLASTNDLGYETITPYFNYENRFTAAKVHGDSSKMGKGWVCENQKGVIVFDLQDVTSISLSMMQKTTVTGTYSITINGKTIVNNKMSSTDNNVIWPTYCRVFNEPTDLVITITCHEGTVGVGPIGVTY